MAESQYICTSCGEVGKPKTNTKGSFWMEVLLGLFFVIPGVFYSFWRLGNKVYACPACGNETVIPTDTPMGQKLLKDLKQERKTS